MGAGAYYQTGVGVAASTGDEDQMMRFLPSFSAVQYMGKLKDYLQLKRAKRHLNQLLNIILTYKTL